MTMPASGPWNCPGEPAGPPPITALIPEDPEEQLREAREEIALLEEQLFQVQEELEHYFLLAQARLEQAHLEPARLEPQGVVPRGAFAAQARHRAAAGAFHAGRSDGWSEPPEPVAASAPAREEQNSLINRHRHRLLSPL